MTGNCKDSELMVKSRMKVTQAAGKRINWIDCAKAIAIMAVIVDHCNGILYSNPWIAKASYFSVSLFVILAGISVGMSYKNDIVTEKNKIIKKVKNLYIQYAIATLIVISITNKFFDLKVYLDNLINFSAAGPYYYFVFYFQLVVISPILIQWCRFCEKHKMKYVWHIGTLFVLGILAAGTINYTYIFPIHGGGKFLLGGTYCLLYYVGILLQEKNCFSMSRQNRIILAIVLTLAWLLWLRGMCQGILPFDKWMEPWWGVGFNPPSVILMIFTMITVFLCYSIFSLMDEREEVWLVKGCIFGLTWIGRNTIYIFMYHLLVMSIGTSIFSRLGVEFLGGGLLLRLFSYIGILILPVLVKKVVCLTGERLVLVLFKS